MIDNAIYSILSANSGVNGIVSLNIFPGVADQEDLDTYVVYHLIDTVPENTKDGVSLLDEARVQVNCFSPVKSNCNTLATNIRTALDRYRGTAGSMTIDKIIFQDARNDYDIDRKIYQVQQDFILRHKK